MRTETYSATLGSGDEIALALPDVNSVVLRVEDVDSGGTARAALTPAEARELSDALAAYASTYDA